MSDTLIELTKRQEYQRRIERGPLFKELQRNPELYDILIAHGSNSGSLIGFAVEKGLVPAGWMLIENSVASVPFSGELSKGLFRERGVNKKAVSFGGPSFSGHREAHDYATTTNETKRNVEGWTPELGRRIMELSHSKLEDPYYAKDESLRDTTLKSIEIEERRIAAFNTLSPQEQNFVTDPYSVVYGVHYEHYRDIVSCVEKMYDGMGSEITGEVYIEGKIDASLLTLFVPRVRIEETKEYLKVKGDLSVPVFPLEVYSFLVKRDWANWDPSGDIYKQARTLWECFPTLHHYIEGMKRWVGKSPIME